MSARLRVALAGAGMVSRHHRIAWARCAGAELVAVADPDRARARAAAEEAGVAAVFADVAAMLDAVRPDAIDIATPLATHAALVLAAAERGCAVLCQKPFAPSRAEAEAVAAAVAGRVRVMVHENWRFRPPYRQARRWIADGRIGRVRRLTLSARTSSLLPPAAGGTPPGLVRQPFLATMPRLVILELLIHHLDVARSLAGPLRVVAARRDPPPPGFAGETAAMVGLAGAEGLVAEVRGDMRAAGAPVAVTDRLEVVGEAGTITFDGRRLVLRTGAAEEAHDFDPDAAYQAGYDAAIAHFVEALRTGAPFETDLADNLDTLALVDDAYRLSDPPA